MFLLILVDNSLIFFYSLTLFHRWYASVWLHDAVVSSYVPSHYMAVGLHDAFPVKDPHFTIAFHRVSSSSAVRASGQVMQGHGWKSHLELGFFFSDLMSFLHFMHVVLIILTLEHVTIWTIWHIIVSLVNWSVSLKFLVPKGSWKGLIKCDLINDPICCL